MSPNRAIDWPAQIDYTKQSVAVSGTKKPGQTAHYRNGVFGYIEPTTPNVLTVLTEAFEAGLELSRDGEFLGHRPLLSSSPPKYADYYVWETYGQVDVRRRRVGSALSLLFQRGDLGGGELETVGIWSQNRPEWQIIDLALHAYNKVGVTLYDTLGKDSVEYIINHSQLSVVFTTSDHIPTLLKLIPRAPVLKMIVSIDNLSPETKQIIAAWADSQKVQVMELRELEELGKDNLLAPVRPTHHQVASICYTSGTTNNPKGVVLSHVNLALAAQGNLYGMGAVTLLSYLPLAHIYERVVELVAMTCGGRIGYFTGDPLRLLEDAQILKPQFFPSVPRVLNRLYQAAMAAGNAPGLKGALFRKAVQVKLDKLHATGDNTHVLWDRLVFRKIQAVLGGNVSMIVTGSAPISPEVVDFLKISFGGDVFEGYGLTENSACCTRSLPGDPSSSGTVGPPQVTNEVKLVDVPSMGYTSEDRPNPRGELYSRGWCSFSVYHKDEKTTKSTIDEEGWIHTGDVAELDSCGRFKIIDRVKNIMKLAQGEYVALEKIENAYSASPAATQIYVHGDSLQAYLIAVVVCDPVYLAATASKLLHMKCNSDDTTALSKMANDPQVTTAILAALAQEAKKKELKGFETIKRIHVTLEPFSIENGTITPTFKLRRRDVYAKYKAELDALYSLGEPKL